MSLPAEIPTLEASNTKNHTRPDNVFCSEDLHSRLVYCKTDPALRPPKTDHYPIIYEIDITTTKAKVTNVKNFAEVDWPAFSKHLHARLLLIDPPTEIRDIDHFEQCRTALETAIADTVEALLEVKKSTKYSKRWFSLDLKSLQQQLRSIARKSYRYHHDTFHPCHEEYRQARNNYTTALRLAKKECWNNWLENEVSQSQNPWKASKLVTKPAQDGGRSRIPEVAKSHADGSTLYVTSNADKSQAFHQEFFQQQTTPTQFLAIPDPRNTHPQPRPKFQYQAITDNQVLRSLCSLKYDKATRPGTPHNNVLRRNAEILTPFIAPLFRATFHLEYYPTEWSTSNTIVLPKPSKPDYRQPNAYRPITLSHGLGRAINKCVKDIIQYQCETHGLIPDKQYGGRSGRAATDAVIDLTETIKQTWRQQEVASALFLDVKGAFPSVITEILTHEMQQLGIPRQYTQWLQRRFDNRWTTLSFDDYESEPFEVIDGLDQGCPGSSFYWILYCAPLLDMLKGNKKVKGFTFVDDHTIAAKGKTFAETHALLEYILWKDNGVMDWATSHNCTFGINKFQLVDFTKATEVTAHTDKGKPIRTPKHGNPIEIDDHQIQPRTSAKLLGVIMDAQLNWTQHLHHAIKKGRTWLNNFSRLSKVNGGVSPSTMRRYYNAIAIPSMLYSAEIFLSPQRTITIKGNRRRVPSNSKIKMLSQIQRQAGIKMCGALQSTSNDNVNFHAVLTPLVATIDCIQQRAAVRLGTLPTTHPLHKQVKKAQRCKLKHHRGPVEELVQQYKIQPDKIATIPATQRPPAWKLRANVHIQTRKIAIQTERQLRAKGWSVYTDSSGYEEQVGSAAVLYKLGRYSTELHQRIGALTKHEVYEGEVAGLILGLHILHQQLATQPQRHDSLDITFYSDNEAALDAITLHKTKAAVELWHAFHNSLQALLDRFPWTNLTFRWLPGHAGVPGNERADRLAKEAAMGQRSSTQQLPTVLRPPLPHNPTSLIKSHRQKSQDACMHMWLASKTAKHLSVIDKNPTSKSFQKLSTSLDKIHNSILVQLRTGHIGLGAHLYRIGKTDSPICQRCNKGEETVFHFLLHCPSHHQARLTIQASLGLFGNNVSAILSKRNNLPALIDFVRQTNHLDTFPHIPPLNLDRTHTNNDKHQPLP